MIVVIGQDGKVLNQPAYIYMSRVQVACIETRLVRCLHPGGLLELM